MVGTTEQPEVQKNVDDAGASLAAISDQYSKRSQELESALAQAVHFQDQLMVSSFFFKTIILDVCDQPS